MDVVNHSETILQVLEKSPLFSSLSKRQLKELLPLIKVLDYSAGEMIIYEHDEPVDLYVIWTGEVEILKKTDEGLDLRISTLHADEVIGELALLDNSPRSASVRAIAPTKLLAISLSDLRTLGDNGFYQQLMDNLSALIQEVQKHKDRQPFYFTLVSNFANILSERMRRTNQVTIDSLTKELGHYKARIAMGKFMVSVIITIAVYMYTLVLLKELSPNAVSTVIISIPLIIVFGVVMLFFMKSSGYPLSSYGLTLNNWRPAVKESILFSVALIVFLVLTKWLAINLFPQFSHLSLIAFNVGLQDSAAQQSMALYAVLILAYLIFTPIQELICRGGLQSALQELLIGPNRVWWAIIISNVLFSVTHLHVSFALAVSVLLPGLFWGWLYARHRTLVGVSLSHLICGGVAFFVLDIKSILV